MLFLSTYNACVGQTWKQYPNVNNFIKVFRDRVHTTPLQYRLHQNGSSSLTE